MEEREHTFDKTVSCRVADAKCQMSEIDGKSYRWERSPYIAGINKASGRCELTNFKK